MTANHRGIVKFWRSEKGWGAISSEVLPAGRDAWVHFSVVDMGDRHVYVELTAGQPVEFDYEVAQQDSFDFRATWVRPLA